MVWGHFRIDDWHFNVNYFVFSGRRLLGQIATKLLLALLTQMNRRFVIGIVYRPNRALKSPSHPSSPKYTSTAEVGQRKQGKVLLTSSSSSSH